MAIEALLRRQISTSGYVNLAQMMEIVLSSNPKSYYNSKIPFGEAGDFVTSPEISQMFGEIIGIWCVDMWLKLGSPSKINIVELGPGRGVLMRDLIRGTKHISSFHKAINIELIEISNLLKIIQRENLTEYLEKISWHNELGKTQKIPTIFIANEFFDAMPIRQYVKHKHLWQEQVLMVDIHDSKLQFEKLGINQDLQEQLQFDHPRAEDGAVVEESPTSVDIFKSIANHIQNYGGAALIIDYGYDIPLGERKTTQYIPTLQAIKSHKFQPIIATLGEADLSAHVDFDALKRSLLVSKVKAFGTINQRDFLINSGLMMRYEMLLNRCNTQEEKIVLTNQVSRLVSPEHMGELFKVLMLTPSKDIIPLGISTL